MPSKFSDQLKQAIIYIKAGELEIAKEIIMEIIQNDPDYEKAWIWLLETMPDRLEKAEILKTRIEQYPDNSPLSHRALEKIAPDMLDALTTEKETSFVPPSPSILIEEESEEDEVVSNVFEPEDLVDEQFGLVEEDVNEFEDIKSIFKEPFEDDEAFSATDRFDELLQDETEEKNISTDDQDFNLIIDEKEDEAFSATDRFDELLQDETEEKNTSIDDLDFDLIIDENDNEEQLEKDLEQFLEDDFNEGYFTETLENKPDQPEAGETQNKIEEEDDESDLLDFDSWLQVDEDESNEEDELSLLLTKYIDTQEEPPKPPETGETNPFILSSEESIELFGEDVTETSKTGGKEENTGQSSNAFSAEGLKELILDDDEFKPQLDFLTDDDLFFPDSDQVLAEPISASDMRQILENKPDSAVMGEQSAKKSSANIESAKKSKQGKKGKNDKQVFMFGCTIIGVFIILTLLGLGFLFLKNWQSRPQEPTLIVLPSTTPTEEYILEAPWLEEEAESSTPVPPEAEE